MPLELELMLVGRVLLLLPFIGAGVESETSDACVEEIELSSKLSLIVSDRVWRIEPPFTLSLFTKPNWFVGSRLRISGLLLKIVELSWSERNDGISSGSVRNSLEAKTSEC